MQTFAMIAQDDGGHVMCMVAADSAAEARQLASEGTPVKIDWLGGDVEFKSAAHLGGGQLPPKAPIFWRLG